MQNNDRSSNLLKKVEPASRITGIGSVPFTDIDNACKTILHYCPSLPYVPQFVKTDFRENMFFQFSENLPCIKIDIEQKRLYYNESEKAAKLAEFYDYVAHNCYDFFKISPEFSKGFYSMLSACKGKNNVFIKSQVTGPITYLLSITDSAKRSIIYDDELADAITLGLGMKALWQAKEIKKIGKIPIIFYDEPSLWGLGSAYLPIGSDKVGHFLNNLMGFIKERDPNILLGLHCCGNTDWEMIFESDTDIVSFDSCSFGDKVALYPSYVERFLNKDKFLAVGIVPTSEYKDEITEEYLYQRALIFLDSLEKKGIDRNLLLRSALFTPACGMGPLPETSATRILGLVANVTKKITNNFITV